MIKNNDTEELIFDYLEGNLTPNEREAFEILMSDSAVLREQVKVWQKTFIAETFQTTAELEQLISKPYSKNRRTFSPSIFILILLTLLCVPSSVEEKLDVNFGREERMEERQTTKETQPSLTTELLPTNTKAETIHKIPVNPSQQEIISRHPALENEYVMLSTPLRPAIVLVGEFIPSLPNDKQLKGSDVQAQNQIIHNKKQFTQRQIREIYRSKIKNQERALEQKYKKGKIPYVIPLDSNF